MPVRPRQRFARITARMTAVNAVIMVCALVTGPLQARALGPSGRGDLAAILVPFALAPLICHLGIGVVGAREASRGKPLGPLLGSLAAVAVAVGIAGALLGVPLAGVLADGRETVNDYLIIAFALLPVGLLGTLLISVSSGLERWRVVYAARLIPPISGFCAILLLFSFDSLTVESAAAVGLAGGVAATLPTLAVLRGQKLALDPALIRSGMPFGLKAWVGGLANLSNARLDQLLMIPLVTSRQLGLYAVAVSIASFSGAVTAGLGPPLFTRVAAGEEALAVRALRVTLALVAVVTAIVGILTPFAIKALFGSSFEDSIAMTWILLAAGLPLAGATVLAPALTATGRAGPPAIAEILALVVTVIGLVLLLPPLGAVGAAAVSAVAYSLNFVVQFVAARRAFGGGLRDYLIVHRADLAWAREVVRAAWPAWRARRGRDR